MAGVLTAAGAVEFAPLGLRVRMEAPQIWESGTAALDTLTVVAGLGEHRVTGASEDPIRTPRTPTKEVTIATLRI